MTKVKEILDDNDFRDAVRRVVDVVYAAMRVLRLCDHSDAGMDRLYYFVRQANDSLKRKVALLDGEVPYFDRHSIEKDDSTIDSDDMFGFVGRAADAAENDDLLLGTHIKDLWMDRKDGLMHDYSLAGNCSFCLPLFTPRLSSHSPFLLSQAGC